MRVIGITGNYGSGKSSITNMFGDNAVKINLDEIGHKVLQEPNIASQVSSKLGFGYYEGYLDPRIIRDDVFNDYGKLKMLQDITHPRIISLFKEEIKKQAKNHKSNLVIFESAILYESKLDKQCDSVIFVDTNTLIRYYRVRTKRSIGWDMLKKIDGSLMDRSHKVLVADHVIKNNLPFYISKNVLQYQVDKIIGETKC